jgi:hypothetical protein
MDKPEEYIRYIAIANLVDRSIVIEYVPQSKREKISNI